MIEQEKTAPVNESGMRARQGYLYNDKVSENLINKQVFEAENADALQPTINNPIFDFSVDEQPNSSPDEVVELPMWGLPTELQNVVEEVTNGFQCSRDYAVASMMVASSTMMGKSVSSKFNNHLNFPSLWIAIVGRTASGKTAPLSFFFKPIELMEREAIKSYRRELQQWEKQDIKERGDKPKYRHRLINNPSDESVLLELSSNKSICWKTDELRTMFDSWGKYSKNGGGTIIGNLLSIFNNGDVNITRVTSEPIYIPEPNLNIIGGIQPPVLKRVMGNRGFADDGLFQRFLFVFPEGKDIPPFADVAISDNVRGVWSSTIDRLAHIDCLTLSETTSAKQMHVEAINRWRGECNEHYRDIEAMTSLLQKLEIHLCRWSIVTAVLSGQQAITDDIMHYSIECMEYFKRCGEKAFCLIANDDDQSKEPTKADGIKLLKKLNPDLSQPKIAEVMGCSQPYVNKILNQ